MADFDFGRRLFVSAGAAALVLGSGHLAFAQSEEPVDDLKPGQWAWYPERAESGPVVVIVSLSDQLAFVYRNGIRIGVSTISSGRKGFETPTGVFTVLLKERMHHSKKYHDAAMPDSQFFFGGAALHAGGLPGYPSSHGCVHLPKAFAELLFSVTHHGTPVIVTNERSGVGSLSHAGLVLSQADLKQVEELTGHIQSKTLPVDSKGADSDAVALLVSSADSKLYAMRNGEMFLETPISIARPKVPLGEHVYVLKGYDSTRTQFDWMAVGLGSGNENSIRQQKELAATTRLQVPGDAYSQIAAALHPGATFLLTDLPAHPSTRTGDDFLIMRDTGT